MVTLELDVPVTFLRSLLTVFDMKLKAGEVRTEMWLQKCNSA